MNASNTGVRYTSTKVHNCEHTNQVSTIKRQQVSVPVLIKNGRQCCRKRESESERERYTWRPWKNRAKFTVSMEIRTTLFVCCEPWGNFEREWTKGSAQPQQIYCCNRNVDILTRAQVKTTISTVFSTVQ